MNITILKYCTKFTLAAIAFLLWACQNDDVTPDGVSMFPESYTVSIRGSHPEGPIDSDIQVKPDETINQDKISLKAKQSTLSIIINLPFQESFSGEQESIGIVIQNLDENDLWNIEDTYDTFHYSLHSQQRKRALIDYVIGGNNFYYGSINRFDKGGVTIEREGDQLVGTFGGTLQTDGGNGKVSVSGSFRANLLEDNLD